MLPLFHCALGYNNFVVKYVCSLKEKEARKEQLYFLATLILSFDQFPFAARRAGLQMGEFAWEVV